ncbi:type IV pilus assembly PilZ [Labilithrix luteola]|uniref:Type IV pilus assembly PilZ n=1 Tax=Labilithrix luteola TaxID=1391654 RepID=A0A0K1Q8N6_9BACT|nr:PilZ domain-containing protein [Labilithrix luteola]AKV02108.1 type IV pilus assembly PilZ [Labilithrix luteola]
MTTGQYIARFRELHDRAKSGSLNEKELVEYRQARTEFSRLMMVAQQLNRSGKTLRSTLRIAQLFKVELDLGAPPAVRTTTVDLATGGFAALLPMNEPLGKVVGFTLNVPVVGNAPSAIRGTARVASSRPHGGLFRVSFTFEPLKPAEQEQLEVVIIDSVLARFASPV